MPNYTFTFKKDDVFVEFNSKDKDVVKKQFQIWADAADEHVKNLGSKTVNKEQSKSTGRTREESNEQQSIEKTVVKSEVLEETKAEPVSEPVLEQPEQEVKPEVIEHASEPVQEKATVEVLDQASNLLKTINSIQNPQEEVIKPEPTINFDDVLVKSIENPTFEPNKVKDQVFLNFIRSKNTNDKFHYLIITAYFLSEFEKMERFSLKQINAKLMQNLSEVIDHTTLQDAINQGFIELVPDLTGTSEITEYKLTMAGEEFFANRI